MFLGIDIGNTNIVLGLFDKDKLLTTLRLHSDINKTWDEYTLFVETYLKDSVEAVQGIAGASVVPVLTPIWTRLCKNVFKKAPLWVDPSTRLGIKVKLKNPREIGADRLVNAAAAWKLYGGPAIVVDFGTATTFDVISRKGEYLGGVIAPGAGISAEALFQRTAKLPKVEIQKPATAIGTYTIQCIESGLYYGSIGQIKEILSVIKKELKGKPRVIATGGLAPLFKKTGLFNAIDQDLTLTGLKIAYEKQR